MGPALTEIGSTFAAFDAGIVGVEPVEGVDGAGDVDGVDGVWPHCGVDTCARISRALANIRRGTRYFTTSALTPAGRSAGAYAMPEDDRVWPDARTIRPLSSIATRLRDLRRPD